MNLMYKLNFEWLVQFIVWYSSIDKKRWGGDDIRVSEKREITRDAFDWLPEAVPALEAYNDSWRGSS